MLAKTLADLNDPFYCIVNTIVSSRQVGSCTLQNASRSQFMVIVELNPADLSPEITIRLSRFFSLHERTLIDSFYRSGQLKSGTVCLQQRLILPIQFPLALVCRTLIYVHSRVSSRLVQPVKFLLTYIACYTMTVAYGHTLEAMLGPVCPELAHCF